MIAKIENVYIQISGENVNNATNNISRSIRIANSDRWGAPYTIYVSSRDFDKLPGGLNKAKPTDFEEPYNVIVDLRYYNKHNYINFVGLEKV